VFEVASLLFFGNWKIFISTMWGKWKIKFSMLDFLSLSLWQKAQ
jgi:hypothetical protein